MIFCSVNLEVFEGKERVSSSASQCLHRQLCIFGHFWSSCVCFHTEERDPLSRDFQHIVLQILGTTFLFVSLMLTASEFQVLQDR